MLCDAMLCNTDTDITTNTINQNGDPNNYRIEDANNIFENDMTWFLVPNRNNNGLTRFQFYYNRVNNPSTFYLRLGDRAARINIPDMNNPPLIRNIMYLYFLLLNDSFQVDALGQPILPTNIIQMISNFLLDLQVYLRTIDPNYDNAWILEWQEAITLYLYNSDYVKLSNLMDWNRL